MHKVLDYIRDRPGRTKAQVVEMLADRPTEFEVEQEIDRLIAAGEIIVEKGRLYTCSR